LKRSIGNTAVLWTTQEERDFWRLIIFNNMIRVRAASSHQRGGPRIPIFHGAFLGLWSHDFDCKNDNFQYHYLRYQSTPMMYYIDAFSSF
jgi:hypothetical protein